MNSFFLLQVLTYFFCSFFTFSLQGSHRSTRWTACRTQKASKRLSVAGLIETSFPWIENALLFQAWKCEYKNKNYYNSAWNFMIPNTLNNIHCTLVTTKICHGILYALHFTENLHCNSLNFNSSQSILTKVKLPKRWAQKWWISYSISKYRVGSYAEKNSTKAIIAKTQNKYFYKNPLKYKIWQHSHSLLQFIFTMKF